MNSSVFYSCGKSSALPYTCRILEKSGIRFADRMCPDVDFLLADVPCKTDITQVLMTASKDITVIGGNLEGCIPPGVKSIDLLKDERYLWNNAEITARCAIRLACDKIQCTLRRCPVLIIGFGRIGIHLASILSCLGAEVTIAARNPAVLAMADSFRYRTSTIQNAPSPHYRIVWNTVPALLYDSAQFPNSLIFDLASAPGVSGDCVIQARGLPGKIAPETSGLLIAQTILSMIQGGNI